MSNIEHDEQIGRPNTPTEIDRAQSKSINVNRMASFGAVLISLMALGVSVLEVNALKAQQKAMIWPFISIKNSYSNDGFELILENKGVGPAVINRVNISYKGVSYQDLDALIETTVGEEAAFSYDVYSGSNPTGSVMAAREVVTLFSVPWEPRTERLLEAWDNAVVVSACYCSIQEDCWISQLDQNMSQKVASCSIDD